MFEARKRRPASRNGPGISTDVAGLPLRLVYGFQRSDGADEQQPVDEVEDLAPLRSAWRLSVGSQGELRDRLSVPAAAVEISLAAVPWTSMKRCVHSRKISSIRSGAA
jgi:hypothetical protein